MRIKSFNQLIVENTRKTWTREECSKIALKYENRNEFIKNDRKAYLRQIEDG